MFWHFDHRYGTYEGQSEKQANKGVLPRVSDASHDSPAYRIEPRYWVDAELTHDALNGEQHRRWHFAWRDVGPSERTLVGTIIPLTASGHKAPILISPADPKQMSALVAILSSLVVDYCARQKSNAMTFFVVEQIAVLPPKVLAERPPWLGSRVQDWLSDRVLELSYTNDELAEFATDLGRSHLPFRWQPDRRLALQAEVDAAVLHLYGLNKNQAEWLLDSFTVLRKYEERDHNEFRTKRVVLEIYDEMAAAKQASRAYQTRLQPVPADPSLCHSGTVTPARPSPATIAAGAWARPRVDIRAETGAMLVALLKAIPNPVPASRVRVGAILALEPRLLLAYLSAAQSRDWKRLIGEEANPLPTGAVQFVPPTDQHWGGVVRGLRTSGALIEDSEVGTWSAGQGLDEIDTEGWPDGRARFVLDVLAAAGEDVDRNKLPAEVRRWLDAEAA